VVPRADPIERLCCPSGIITLQKGVEFQISQEFQIVSRLAAQEAAPTATEDRVDSRQHLFANHDAGFFFDADLFAPSTLTLE
jgi:hypothetical protein